MQHLNDLFRSKGGVFAIERTDGITVLIVVRDKKGFLDAVV